MVLPSLQTGGMEVFSVYLAGALLERGHEISITVIDDLGPVASLAKELGVSVDFVPISRSNGRSRWAGLIAHLEQERPSIVHTHTGAWVKGAWAAKLAGIKRLVHTIHGLHETTPFRGQLLESLADFWTNRVTLVSDSLRSEYAYRLPKNGRRLEVIPNGVFPFSTVGRGEARRRLGLQEEHFVFGTIGRLVPVKNHAGLIHAFAETSKTLPHSRLALVGSGPDRPILEKLTNDLGMAHAVLFCGAVPEARKYLKAFDIFCLPSHSEGTSIALLEAMQAGIPIVASPVGDTPEIVDGLARLVSPSDISGLASALVQAAEDQTWRYTSSISIQERARLQYGMEKCTSAYERLYENVLL